MKLKYWIPFAVVQTVGFILPRFANFHSNVAPLVLGIVLLLTGKRRCLHLPPMAIVVVASDNHCRPERGDFVGHR